MVAEAERMPLLDTCIGQDRRQVRRSRELEVVEVVLETDVLQRCQSVARDVVQLISD